MSVDRTAARVWTTGAQSARAEPQLQLSRGRGRTAGSHENAEANHDWVSLKGHETADPCP